MKAVDAAFAAEVETELEFVFVDDGSVDATFKILAGMAEEDARIKVIRLSRNFGEITRRCLLHSPIAPEMSHLTWLRIYRIPRRYCVRCCRSGARALLWYGAAD